MWKLLGFSSLFVLFAAINIAGGLECYSCFDVESLPEKVVEGMGNYLGMQGSKSCQRGKIPDSKLKARCQAIDEDGVKDTQLVCAQGYVEIPNGTTTWKVTARSCFYGNRTVEDLTKDDSACKDITFQNLFALSAGYIRKELEKYKDSLPPNSPPGRFCHCNGDNCNAAVGMSTGSMLPMLMGMIVAAWFHFIFH